MIHIREMVIEDYKEVYDLWIHTPGMGLFKVCRIGPVRENQKAKNGS